jgi:3,4-dihydroxy 2-butanone 4-phosphate synthase/GTP cyclohydrolase II
MVVGEIGDGEDVVVRLHSECLTGDALSSLRCDCGIQLRHAMRVIAAEQRGVLLYATGHEGRGIGLVNKLKAYVAQDHGVDTVDANLELGLPVDAREYDDAASVLRALGVRTTRLLTNNPAKVDALVAAGIGVNELVPLTTAAHVRNRPYLTAKQARMGHRRPMGAVADELRTVEHTPIDVAKLLGEVRTRPDRPYVVAKFAQTLDGRIATATGDSQWISGEAERCVSHSLRAACDGVLVGSGTVVQDDPQLTVRMVPGASPARIVLDSRLRIPTTANVLRPDAPTTVITTQRAPAARQAEFRALGTRLLVVPEGPSGVDLPAALRALRTTGTMSLLVEGGARVLTALIAEGLVDRLIVAIAPLILGEGTEAIGDLAIQHVIDGVQLVDRSIHPVGDDVLIAWDIAPSSRSSIYGGRDTALAAGD